MRLGFRDGDHASTVLWYKAEKIEFAAALIELTDCKSELRTNHVSVASGRCNDSTGGEDRYLSGREHCLHQR